MKYTALFAVCLVALIVIHTFICPKAYMYMYLLIIFFSISALEVLQEMGDFWRTDLGEVLQAMQEVYRPDSLGMGEVMTLQTFLSNHHLVS